MVVQLHNNSQSSSNSSTNRKIRKQSKAARTCQKALKVLRDQTENFKMINPDAAGIDVGSEQMFVAVPADRDPVPIRHFNAYTEDLIRLADWLISCNITSIVMESTGLYWIPLFQILESRGLQVYLVNARHAKNLPGRKTDVLDCQWLQKLHTFGLLSASFRPPDEICVLRSFIRHRRTLIEDSGTQVQHMQSALTQMNVLVHKAVSDLTGKTGMSIVEAILGGEKDPHVLASYRDCRCKKDKKLIAKYLTGDIREEHLFVLKQAHDSWCHIRRQMGECDQKIQELFGTFSRHTTEDLPSEKRSKPKQNDLPFDLANHFYQFLGVDLTEIHGIDSLTILTIVSEIGTDLSPWRTSRHFASWLGLCPNNRISGGKLLGVRTRKVPNRVANALRIAAKSLQRSQNALGAFFRRMSSKLGYQEAVTAVAHKLARIIYAMIKFKSSFDPERLDRKHEARQKNQLQNMKKIANSMGYKLIPISEANSV